MTIDLFNLIGLAYLSNMVVSEFKPIQPAKEKVVEFLYTHLPPLSILLTCSKCLAFWLGLFIYVDIFHAALAGFFGYLVKHLIDRINFWYE
jgi:hypothetical protein